MNELETVPDHTDEKKAIPPMPAWYYEAFGMRILGVPLKKIAKDLGKSESHVKALFSHTGKLYGVWRDFVERNKKGVLEESMDMIYGHLPDITRAAINVAKNDKDPMGVRQRERLFDMTHGKPKENLEVNMNFTIADFVRSVTRKTKDESDKPDIEGTASHSPELAG